MPRNGTGNFSLPAGNPVVTGTTISSTVQNSTMTDIGTALTQSLAYDGQTNPVANLPMAGFKHTGVANASARTDYASAGQVQDNSLTWAGTAGGTANALTLTLSPAITAIAAGQRFAFKSGASPNSAATTVAISGLTAIAVQVNGVACAGGEIAASKWYEIVVDASLTSCQLHKLGRATLTELGISAFAQTILDDADASTVLTTLGFSTFAKTIIDDADASAALSTLGFSAFIKTLVDDADAAAARATLGIGSRSIGQIVTSATSAVATGTTVMPYDDTIPQSTEGDQYLSLAITPQNASSTLEIEVVIAGISSSVVNDMVAALFQDAGANALAAEAASVALANASTNLSFTHIMTAGTTSATTFKIRAGGSLAGTTTFNGSASARKLGGVLASRITITEILP